MSGHILVVEDEGIVAMNLQSTLGQLGYETTHASTGEEALEKAGDIQPDLVLMDIMLGGGIDGVETASRLRADMGLPIVYLTAFADEKTVERAKRTEPMGYLIKPFREDELHSTIEVAFFRHQAEKRFREKESLYNVILESMQDAVIMTGPDRRITFTNEIATSLLDGNPKECVGKEISDVLGSLDEQKRSVITGAVSRVLQNEGSVELADESIVLSGSGDSTYLAASVARLQNSGGNAGGAVLLFRRVGDRRQAPKESAAIDQAREQAQGAAPPQPGLPAGQQTTPAEVSSIKTGGPPPPDKLTGLAARGEAEAAITAAVQRRRHAYAVVFVLDRFPLINERYGQAATDELIQFYSIHLAQGLSPEDELYRWSGPSFVSLMERPTSKEAVRRELMPFAAVRLEKVLRVHARSALILISADWNVLSVRDYTAAEDCIQAVDSFVASRLRISV